MSYQKEKKRVSNQANEFDGVAIHRDNEYIIGGDVSTVCVIWNNLIGANMDTKEEYENYLRFMKSQKMKSGQYTFVGDGQTIVETIQLEIP